MKKLSALILFALLPLSGFSQSHTKVALVGEVNSIQPGQPFWIGLQMIMEPKWHTYWMNPGQGLPTEVDWKLPDGFTASKLYMPTPEIIEFAGSNTYGYEGEILHLIKVTPPAKMNTDSITIEGDVSWLECKDSCIPGSDEVSLTLPVEDGARSIDPAHVELFAAARKHLPQETPHTFRVIKRATESVTLQVSGPALENPVYLHAEPDIFDPDAKQTFVEIEGGFELTIPLLEDETAPDVLSGILVLASAKHQSVAVTTDRGDGTPEVADTPSPAGTSLSQTTDPSPPAKLLANGLPASTQAAIDEISSWGSVDLAGATEKKRTLPLMILFAFVGGIILNIMPCVFPVIGIKIMGFVNQAGDDKSKIRLHGLIFAAGVIVSMWVLVSVLLGVRAAGESAGWGFQLQSPGFLTFMIAILFVLGLSMAGLFEIGLSMTTVGGELQQKKGVSGSFFSGVLAVLVATPCTGPFMGPAIGFALSASIAATFAVFTALALGVAFPYVLLSFFPTLVQKLPRPGPWMETFKQAMSFLLFATVIWLLSVFGKVTSIGGLTYLLFGLLALSIGGWLYGRYGNPAVAAGKRRTALVFTAVMAGLFGYAAIQGANMVETKRALTTGGSTVKKFGMDFEVFSPERLVDLRTQGRAVFVDFTADW